jgi:hypothetical protein
MSAEPEERYRSAFYLYTGIQQRGATIWMTDAEDYGQNFHTYASEADASEAYERITQALKSVRDALVTEGWEWP